MTPSVSHEQATADAFDGQASAFERAPIQNDGRLLTGLVKFADLPAGASVADAGCGPGLVAEVLLADPRGYTVTGFDLSREMVRRADERCRRFGSRARFEHRAFDDDVVRGHTPFDAVVTRLVLHHIENPSRFVGSLVAATRPGGVVVIADHIADADPALAAWHRRLETMRDRTHVANISGGELIDLLARADLEDLRYQETVVSTHFDEWFARGTPSVSRDECREVLLSPNGRGSRAWRTAPMPDGDVTMTGIVAFVRARVPT
jgi:2-polyprenyl-3-methyl-5-hydroxy-6-metoxy-1,4-benzoquinol methylase